MAPPPARRIRAVTASSNSPTVSVSSAAAASAARQALFARRAILWYSGNSISCARKAREAGDAKPSRLLCKCRVCAAKRENCRLEFPRPPRKYIRLTRVHLPSTPLLLWLRVLYARYTARAAALRRPPLCSAFPTTAHAADK